MAEPGVMGDTPPPPLGVAAEAEGLLPSLRRSSRYLQAGPGWWHRLARWARAKT